jgi:hypothetical protein
MTAFVESIVPVGPDAIVEFRAEDGPGERFRAVVPACHRPDRLRVGDPCLFRLLAFKARSGAEWEFRWEFAGRSIVPDLEDAGVGKPPPGGHCKHPEGAKELSSPTDV